MKNENDGYLFKNVLLKVETEHFWINEDDAQSQKV